MVRGAFCYVVILVCVVQMAPIALCQAVNFDTSTSPYLSSTHADFNSDGGEDFINDTGCSGGFGLALSTGDSTWAAPGCYTLPNNAPAYYFAIGDFNGDGNADLIISNETNTIYEYLGSPTGELHLHSMMTASVGVLTMVAADVNRDGKMDLLFWGGDNNLWVWFGNRDGTFRVGPSTPMAGGGGWLSIGDFDGDGKADVFSALGSEGGTTYQVFYGDGTGHFQPSPPVVSGKAGYVVYDVNGDGRSDLIAQLFYFSINGNTYYKVIEVQFGNADRTFTRETIPLAHCDSWGGPPAVADLNGDGINDIAETEAADCKGDPPDTFNVLIGNPNGTYEPEQVIFTGNTTETLSEAYVVRANRDTKPDLLGFFSSGGTANLVFTNTTTGNFPDCNAPNSYTGIAVCSPGTNVLSSSPVKFSIGAANQTPGREVQVWVDGKKVAQQFAHAFSYYTFLDAQVE